MPGPAPKSDEQRQRRNRPATQAQLVANPQADVPPLPPLPTEIVRGHEGEIVEERRPEWSPVVVEEWAAIWRSPMASQYTETDAHGLLQLMILTQALWDADGADSRQKLHAEIRLARRDFGLTPMSRASLHWSIMETEEKAEQRARKRRDRPDSEKALDVLDG
jgi:hypothetical protein